MGAIVSVRSPRILSATAHNNIIIIYMRLEIETFSSTSTLAKFGELKAIKRSPVDRRANHLPPSVDHRRGTVTAILVQVISVRADQIIII